MTDQFPYYFMFGMGVLLFFVFIWLLYVIGRWFWRVNTLLIRNENKERRNRPVEPN